MVDALRDLSAENRDIFINRTETQVQRMVKSIERAMTNFGEVQTTTQLASGMTILGGLKQVALGVRAFLNREYIGPGSLRPEGPRHDNGQYKKLVAGGCVC
jgi:hypothetical protein